MAKVTLVFVGGPKDGGEEKADTRCLPDDEYVERRFPCRVAKGKPKKEHLYQAQIAWDGKEKRIELHYLGQVLA